MNVHYIAGISLRGDSGKSKATREKIEALGRIVNLTYYTIDNYLLALRFGKLFGLFCLEFGYLVKIILQKNRPDVILSRSLLGFGGRLASKIFRIPFVVEIHADFYDEARILFFGKRIKLILSWFLNQYIVFLCKSADGVIYNNQALCDYYFLHYRVETRALVMHNGSDVDFFLPESREVVIDRLGLDMAKKYLVFVGSVSKWHGVEYLLDIMAHFVGSDIELLVVGGGNSSYLDSLKNRYGGSGNIRFVGPVKSIIARDYINVSSLCMLPVNNIRISPGSPLKLFDYAACDRPIITQSSTVGYSDIVERYGLGFCCDLTNPCEAACQIQDYLSAIDAGLICSNRSVAERFLSWSVVVREWLNFISEVQASR